MRLVGNKNKIVLKNNHLNNFLEEAQANIFCSIEDLVPYHTHTIVIGKVLNAISNDKINTLSYINGKYV